MFNKFIKAFLAASVITRAIVIGWLILFMFSVTHYNSWSFELTNKSAQTVYYSLSGKLQDLKPLEPQARITESRRGFTYKLREPYKVIIAREPFVAGQPEPAYTIHEFTAKTVKATIDKDGMFVVNQALPVKQLLPQV